MKKTNKVIKDKQAYHICEVINDTAIIKSSFDNIGLYDIKTRKIISKIDNYSYTIKDPLIMLNINIDNKDYLCIYDTKKEKILANNWLVDKKLSKDDIYILRSNDNKYHIFSMFSYNKDSDIFTIPIDSYNFLDKNIEEFIVLTKDNKQQFMKISDLNIKSEEFNRIESDLRNKFIYYAYFNNKTYVYNNDDNGLNLIYISDYDDIRCLNRQVNNRCFVFKVIRNNKVGIVSININDNVSRIDQITSKSKLILPPSYDDINHLIDNMYVINKNNQKGIFILDKNVIVEPKYSDIMRLNSTFLALYNDNFCNIVSKDDSSKVLVRNCQIVEILANEIIYKVNNLYGIIGKDNSKNIVVLSNYDKVEMLTCSILEIEKNGKKGIIYNGKEIIPPKYNDIKMNNLSSRYFVYFALKNEDKKNILALVNLYNNGKVIYDDQIYNDIIFCKKIMVLKDDNKLSIYDYDLEMISSFKSNTTFVDNQDDTYIIDGISYSYKDNKFKKIYNETIEYPLEDVLYYVTTYETDKDTYEIKSLNKDALDSFCGVIDELDDKVASYSLERAFKSHNNKELSLQLTYQIKKI